VQSIASNTKGNRAIFDIFIFVSTKSLVGIFENEPLYPAIAYDTFLIVRFAEDTLTPNISATDMSIVPRA